MADPSAGALLRAAREKQGLHIAALAAAIKVTPKKLEALEADRWDELSGAIFTRALAQSICRVLRIDPKPVLALLPQPESQALDKVIGPLNAPFRDGGGRDDRAVTVLAQRVLVAAAALLLVAAGALFVLPTGFWRSAPVIATSVPGGAMSPPSTTGPDLPPNPSVAVAPVPATTAPLAESAATPAATLAVASAAPAPTAIGAAAVTPTAATATASPTAATAATLQAASSAAPGGNTLRIEAIAPSWVEVRDRAGRVLLSRQLAAQEVVGLDGNFPLALTVGNAASTKVMLRGTPVDLVTVARNNVARIEVH